MCSYEITSPWSSINHPAGQTRELQWAAVSRFIHLELVTYMTILPSIPTRPSIPHLVSCHPHRSAKGGIQTLRYHLATRAGPTNLQSKSSHLILIFLSQPGRKKKEKEEEANQSHASKGDKLAPRHRHPSIRPSIHKDQKHAPRPCPTTIHGGSRYRRRHYSNTHSTTQTTKARCLPSFVPARYSQQTGTRKKATKEPSRVCSKTFHRIPWEGEKKGEGETSANS